MFGRPPNSDSESDDLPATDCFPGNKKKCNSVSWGPNRCFSPISWVSTANARSSKMSNSASATVPVKTQDSENGVGSSCKYSTSMAGTTSPVTKVSVSKSGTDFYTRKEGSSPRAKRDSGPMKSFSAPVRRQSKVTVSPMVPRASTAKPGVDKWPSSGATTPISVMDLHVSSWLESVVDFLA